MVIVKLMGGLGNQMFQYALGKSLSVHLKTNFKLDLDFLLDRTPRENFVFRDYDLDVFRLHAERASKEDIAPFFPQNTPEHFAGRLFRNIQSKFSSRKYFYEPHFHFTPAVFDLPKDCYLEGYWQSDKYFKDVEEEIRTDFTFKGALSPLANDMAKLISGSNSVCINVRRTDFVNSSFHGVCDMKYFIPAIDIIKSKVDNPHFFIFSDDPAWCLENFTSVSPATFVGHEYKGYKFSDYLHLMSLCRHFIIPNSSFAWWATWLNRDKDKIVIAPKIWFNDQNYDDKDLIPDNWIRIAN